MPLKYSRMQEFCNKFLLQALLQLEKLVWKEHSTQVFHCDQNVSKILNSILTKFKLCTSFRFQDIAVQNLQISFYFSVAIS